MRRILRVVAIAALFTGLLHGASIAETTVGVIYTRDVYFFGKLHDSFMNYLSEKGYDRSVKFIIQRPYPDPIAWSNASRKLIAADVDLIVAYGAPAVLSALKERPSMPVLYAGVYEPIAKGIKTGNATGVCSKFQISSLLRYLRESKSLDNLGVVYSSLEEDSVRQLEEIKEMSRKYGFSVKELNLRRQGDIAGMLADIEVSAIFLTSSSLVNSVLPTIVRITESRKIPTASLLRHEELHPLITLSSNPEEEGRLAAEMFVKLLKGSSVSSVEKTCSKDIELIFNMKQARNIGVRISMDLVVEATKILY